MAALPDVFLGTAAWSIPKALGHQFDPGASVLARYAQVFPAVEINTSFYRPHQPSTYERWADSTPEQFRFSVKMPKQISHEARLLGCEAALDRFLHASSHLGRKLGCLLLQLPPSFSFDRSVEPFLRLLRTRYLGDLAIEPRHSTWWQEQALAILNGHGARLVAADPPRPGHASIVDMFALPLFYVRLHGAPKIYWSAYEEPFLAELAKALKHQHQHVWCIFDNTASGSATADALRLKDLLGGAVRRNFGGPLSS